MYSMHAYQSDIKGISLKLLQISFDLFQFISSKFWKGVNSNLFSHFQWYRYLNKFLSKITSIITYLKSADYAFFILSGK